MRPAVQPPFVLGNVIHLILLLPLAALPLFWVLPLPLALPLYIFCVVVAGLAWWFITRSLKRRVVTGAPGLIGTVGEVISPGNGAGRDCLVRAAGELWSARCDTGLHPGDSVVIRGVKGIRLKVAPSGPPDSRYGK